jgi:hypothetical protein
VRTQYDRLVRARGARQLSIPEDDEASGKRKQDEQFAPSVQSQPSSTRVRPHLSPSPLNASHIVTEE